MKKAIYPGSFDPVTNGHVDIITRASLLAEELIVAVLDNSQKSTLFTIEERVELLKEITKNTTNVKILSFNGLLVDFAKQCKINTVIRGLRATTDFEYEFQMALTNRKLYSGLETLFISASPEYLYINSSMVKEIARYDGIIDDMVQDVVKQALRDKYRKN